ncbi:HutD family protein [Methyloraptor flagellatus]|jgi:environmental stress-induced protein Ves|uniref:HutD family protein n=1 Tax=Methyloraptor flagellatus TaxID=3162530 RepID=A0AAU7XHX9_9HYPH
MTGVRLLRATDRAPKPWKNGGGVTTDVLVRPEGAGLDDFEARISIAEVAASGPFSVFPGIDRSTAILAGAGMDLMVGDAAPARLAPGGAPHRYPGDVPTSATLVAGPITDLNVMTRRGVVAHEMRRIALAPGSVAPFDLADAAMLWQSGDGVIETPGGTVTPAPLDAITCATPGRWRVTTTTDVVLFVIGFVRRT